ncbi:MAG: esterase [Ferruginibacter sp.]|nr:esterase [Ferruginibacter sp.]
MLAQSCAFKRIDRSKNIVYLPATASRVEQTLNVFSPRKKQGGEVMIFVHGGNWNSGRKGLYSFFGTRFARKGVTTVVVDYPKSPAAGYDEMAIDIAEAVKWVSLHIGDYGGDTGKIFISGHSAGGHLAALVAIKPEYFQRLKMANPLKGIVLIDAAGLDMYTYLKEESFEEGHTYLKTFGTDPASWKAASAMYFLHKDMPPMLIYRGGRTYLSIEQSHDRFISALKNFVPAPDYHVLKGKKHVPMILQFFNSSNPRFAEIISFMKNKSRAEK